MLQGRWKIFRTKATRLLEAGDFVACIKLAQSFLASIDKDALDSSARNYSESDTTFLLNLDPTDFPIPKANPQMTLHHLNRPQAKMNDLHIITQISHVIYGLITISVDETCLDCRQGPLELILNVEKTELLLECPWCYSYVKQTLSGKPSLLSGASTVVPTIAQIRMAGGSHLLPEDR